MTNTYLVFKESCPCLPCFRLWLNEFCIKVPTAMMATPYIALCIYHFPGVLVRLPSVRTYCLCLSILRLQGQPYPQTSKAGELHPLLRSSQPVTNGEVVNKYPSSDGTILVHVPHHLPEFPAEWSSSYPQLVTCS